MDRAFVAIVPTRPCPLFGRPVHRRGGPHRLRPGASPQALRTPPRGGHPALPDLHGQGQRGVTPAFGYGALHPSASGTLTHPSTVLPGAHYGAVRLLAGHRPRLMHSPSGYPEALRRGVPHEHLLWMGHGQISLGPLIALSDHSDPKHPRPAAWGLSPYPLPHARSRWSWARLRGLGGRSPRPEATSGSRELRPGRLPRRSSDSASRRTPCALLGRAERVPRPGDLHPISAIEYQSRVGEAPWCLPHRRART